MLQISLKPYVSVIFIFTDLSFYLGVVTVVAQEDLLEILVNEDNEVISETNGESATTNEIDNNQQEEEYKSIKLDTMSNISQNFWNDIIILVLGIIVAISLYFLIKHWIKRAADSLGLDKRQLKGINSITKLIIIVITITIILFQFSSISGVAAGTISVAAVLSLTSLQEIQ